MPSTKVIHDLYRPDQFLGFAASFGSHRTRKGSSDAAVSFMPSALALCKLGSTFSSSVSGVCGSLPSCAASGSSVFEFSSARDKEECEDIFGLLLILLV